MSLLLFPLITTLLTLEGAMLSSIMFGTRDRLRDTLLGLPLASFTNVLVVFVFTVAHIPLTALSILGAHVLLSAFLTYRAWKLPKAIPTQTVTHKKTRLGLVMLTVATFALGVTAIYSFSHAVLLPTFQYDSATNWTMRSKLSFYDRTIAFDATENRGMAKPQYPFLFHALQVTANMGNTVWSDTAANAILYLLSLSFVAAIWLLLSRARGTTHATLTLALIVGALPLFGLHLAQGYGDINLAQELLLSLLFYGLWLEEKDPRTSRAFLFLSSVFAASAVWTKSEGTFLGLVPWIVLAEIGMRFLKKSEKRMILRAVVLTLALAIPWHIFAHMKGLSLTPHQTDTLISLHPEAIPEALRGLFSRGSFGILWFSLTLIIPVLAYLGTKNDPSVSRAQLVPVLWGVGVSVAFLFIYLATPNVVFLLKAESFYRQMMIPAAMLVLACSLCLRPRETY